MKHRYVKVLCALLLLLGFRSFSQTDTGSTGNRLTLKEAVDIAIQKNLELRQASLEVENAAANKTRARANFFPSLEGFANHGLNQGRSIDPFTNQFINQQINFAQYGLNSDVVVFNGLSLNYLARQNAIIHAATQQELQQAKDNLTIDVLVAYLRVLNSADLVQQSIKQADLSRQQAERLEEMHKQGAIPPAQLYDLKGQYAADQLAIVTNKNNLDAAKLDLCQLLNIPYDPALQVERLSVEEFNLDYAASTEEVYQAALQNLGVAKAAKLRRESSEFGVKSVRGELYPTLFLSGNLTTNYSSVALQDIFLGTGDVETDSYVLVNNDKAPVIRPTDQFAQEKIGYRDQLDNNLFTSITLGLRVPIFNNLATRTRLRQAKIALKNSQMVEETTLIQLRQNVEQAYFNMNARRESIKVLTDQVEAFSESFRSAEERFNAGAATSVDYLVARTNYDRANINLITARYEFIFRTKILDYYQAKPIF